VISMKFQKYQSLIIVIYVSILSLGVKESGNFGNFKEISEIFRKDQLLIIVIYV